MVVEDEDDRPAVKFHISFFELLLLLLPLLLLLEDLLVELGWLDADEDAVGFED
jgi:hypothetical protein